MNKNFNNNKYIEELSLVEKYARDNFIPVIPHETANLLCDLTSKSKPKNILEIGTAIGYSGTLMLKTSPLSKLITLDIDDERIKIAQKTFKVFKVQSRVKIIKIDAMEFLQNYQTTENKEFDFIFLDGPKGQYIKYLPYLKEMLSKNGLLVADDVNFLGKVFSEEYPAHKHRTFVINLRKFVKNISDDGDFDTTIYPIGESVLVAKKIN